MALRPAWVEGNAARRRFFGPLVLLIALALPKVVAVRRGTWAMASGLAGTLDFAGHWRQLLESHGSFVIEATPGQMLLRFIPDRPAPITLCRMHSMGRPRERRRGRRGLCFALETQSCEVFLDMLEAHGVPAVRPAFRWCLRQPSGPALLAPGMCVDLGPIRGLCKEDDLELQ
mmetsp:Transcript_20612/g.58440  ORF Transcript_20612/g.58440 Transcript_20612/m.58440 type:complete len:173 (+) Transcript_20612:48-566(+)